LKEEYFDAPNLKVLGLTGGSSITALEVLMGRERLPKIVLIEMNILERGEDPALVQRFTDGANASTLPRPIKSAVAFYERWLHAPPDRRQAGAMVAALPKLLILLGERGGTRTLDPMIKSHGYVEGAGLSLHGAACGQGNRRPNRGVGLQLGQRDDIRQRIGLRWQFLGCFLKPLLSHKPGSRQRKRQRRQLSRTDRRLDHRGRAMRVCCRRLCQTALGRFAGADRTHFDARMADSRTISQLEAEGYPWIGCECCKGTVWVPFRMLRERIPMLSAMTLDQFR
jgi:hypothetical protein